MYVRMHACVMRDIWWTELTMRSALSTNVLSHVGSLARASSAVSNASPEQTYRKTCEQAFQVSMRDAESACEGLLSFLVQALNKYTEKHVSISGVHEGCGVCMWGSLARESGAISIAWPEHTRTQNRVTPVYMRVREKPSLCARNAVSTEGVRGDERERERDLQKIVAKDRTHTYIHTHTYTYIHIHKHIHITYKHAHTYPSHHHGSQCWPRRRHKVRRRHREHTTGIYWGSGSCAQRWNWIFSSIECLWS